MTLEAAVSSTGLFGWLEQVKKDYRAGRINPGQQIMSPLGVHGTEQLLDEDGYEYLLVGFVLPDDVYAEIEDGTYGQLNAFRVYKEEL